MMIKRGVLLLVLASFVLLSGCQTSKSLAECVGCTAEGVGKDSAGLWAAIQKADLWIRQNLW